MNKKKQIRGNNSPIPQISSLLFAALGIIPTAVLGVPAIDIDDVNQELNVNQADVGQNYNIEWAINPTGPWSKSPNEAQIFQPISGSTMQMDISEVMDRLNVFDRVLIRFTELDPPSSIFELEALPPESGARATGSPYFEGSTIKGDQAGDYSGSSISPAGDMNGDGLNDFIVGARLADPAGTSSAGKTYIIYGSTELRDTTIDLGSINASTGRVINGTNPNDRCGHAVQGGFDFNGDGYSDCIIGAHTASADATMKAEGAAFVVFGAANPSASLDLSNLNGSNGFAILTDEDNAGLGQSVSAGDLNGDGLDDLIMGAVQASPSGRAFAGSVYVVYGKTQNPGASINVAQLNGTNGFTIKGIQAGDNSGTSVACVNDINADGYDDVLIGSARANRGGLIDNGEAHVVFGKAGSFGSSFELSALNGSNGFTINGSAAGDLLGISADAAGDVNGDGIADLILGASRANVLWYYDVGEAYVIFGKTSSFSASVSVATLNGQNGTTIEGLDDSDQAGITVAGAGDVNGDGIDDVLVGAELADPHFNTAAGESYLIFGKTGPQPAVFKTADLNGYNGIVINGINSADHSANRVSAAGDIDGDGFSDLLISAPLADPDDKYQAGETYLLHGRDILQKVDQEGDSQTNALTALKGHTARDILIGKQGGDQLLSDGGSDVLCAGSGDDNLGISDLNFRRLDGGPGNDLLNMEGQGILLDLNAQSIMRIRDVEEINLTGTGANSLRLSARALAGLSDSSNELMVHGSSSDTVYLQGSWGSQGIQQGFRIFTSNATRILIDTDIQYHFE